LQLRDLLIADPSSGERLEIRSSVAGGTSGVIVTNLSRVVVSSVREAMAVYERGCALRAVAATGIHDLSSRSHSVLMVEVNGVYVTQGTPFPPRQAHCLFICLLVRLRAVLVDTQAPSSFVHDCDVQRRVVCLP
jgi:hypothetical protein